MPITLERDSVSRFLLGTDQTPGGEGKKEGWWLGRLSPNPRQKLEDPKGRQTSVNDQKPVGSDLLSQGVCVAHYLDT